MTKGRSYVEVHARAGEGSGANFAATQKAAIVGNFYYDYGVDHRFVPNFDPWASGTAHLDLDNDAAHDTGEPLAAGTYHAFSFAVEPGTYVVRVLRLHNGAKLVGPKSYTVTVAAGEVRSGFDFEVK
jgi:hypothetical protein